MASGAANQVFDRAYYARFYESRRTRVYGAEQVAHLVRGVVGFVRWYGGELRTVLDVGAGTGLWREALRNEVPEASYRSIEVSEYACEKYGHERRDITSWRAREKFDLVVCQGVLPYLDDAACARAIENLAAMSRGFLYLEAVTTQDLEEVCDAQYTDPNQRGRSLDWYRAHLGAHYVPLGCGLYYAKRGPLAFYELERK